MSRAKLAAAKELIEEKQYATARGVLETIPDDATAKAWLKRLPKKRRVSGLLKAAGIVLVFLVGVGIGSSSRPRQTVVSAPPATTYNALYTTTPAPTLTITPTPTTSTAGTQAVADRGTAMAALDATALAANLALTQAVPPTSSPVSFSGTTDQVLGPITLAPGLYKATVRTEGFFIAELEITEGECGEGSFILSPIIFNLSRGDASPNAEVLIRSTGCKTYIETSNITEPWQLEIAPA